MNQDNTTKFVVQLSLDVEARAETVWSMLTTGQGFSAFLQGHVTMEAKVGAPFRADFPQYGVRLAGEVTRIDPERKRIALTWGSELGPQAADLPAASSLVEFGVTETEAGCRVALRHSGFPNEQLAEEHDAGWRFHLGTLALYANREDLSKGLERTLAGWFAAWNEVDGDARRKILRDCCHEDVEFRDEWAVARGTDRLSIHIENCLRFMPGWKIEQQGEVRICRGEALVGWKASGAGGAQTGHNHVVAAYDGTIRRVAGFRAGS